MWQHISTRLMLIGLLVAVVYFVFSAVSNGLQTHRLHEDQARVQAEIDQLKGDYQSLSGLQEYLNSDEYIESVARQQLGLVRPGETPITVITPTTPPPHLQPTPQGGPWWESYLDH
jgi:cell division protein FtsL